MDEEINGAAAGDDDESSSTSVSVEDRVEDRLPITVMGHSLGGAVVSCLPASLGPAPRGDGIVSSVLVMAPALDMSFAPLSM